MAAKKVQSNTTFAEIDQLIYDYLLQRDWNDLPSKDLAISISLEASELLEHYQWSDASVGNKDEVAAELADIMIYAFQFAQINDIDIADAIRQKLQKAAEKYPAKELKGKRGDAAQKAWLAAKKRYKKEESL